MHENLDSRGRGAGCGRGGADTPSLIPFLYSAWILLLIICPMKSSIKTYCNEGHDILSALDMHSALKERLVTASVGVIDETKSTLDNDKVQGLSKYHNFRFEKNKIRIWRAYSIGKGKTVTTKSTYKKHLVHPSLLNVSNTHGLFPCKSRAMEKKKETEDKGVEEIGVFYSHEPGCDKHIV